MLTTTHKILIGVLTVILIGFGILIYNLFSRNSTQRGDLERLIAAKDEIIKLHQENRARDSAFIVQINEKIELSESRDSALAELDKVLDAKYSQNKVKHSDNKKAYDKIPTDVRNLSNDSLARAISEFFRQHKTP